MIKRKTSRPRVCVAHSSGGKSLDKRLGPWATQQLELFLRFESETDVWVRKKPVVEVSFLCLLFVSQNRRGLILWRSELRGGLGSAPTPRDLLQGNVGQFCFQMWRCQLDSSSAGRQQAVPATPLWNPGMTSPTGPAGPDLGMTSLTGPVGPDYPRTAAKVFSPVVLQSEAPAAVQLQGSPKQQLGVQEDCNSDVEIDITSVSSDEDELIDVVGSPGPAERREMCRDVVSSKGDAGPRDINPDDIGSPGSSERPELCGDVVSSNGPSERREPTVSGPIKLHGETPSPSQTEKVTGHEDGNLQRQQSQSLQSVRLRNEHRPREKSPTKSALKAQSGTRQRPDEVDIVCGEEKGPKDTVQVQQESQVKSTPSRTERRSSRRFRSDDANPKAPSKSTLRRMRLREEQRQAKERAHKLAQLGWYPHHTNSSAGVSTLGDVQYHSMTVTSVPADHPFNNLGRVDSSGTGSAQPREARTGGLSVSTGKPLNPGSSWSSTFAGARPRSDHQTTASATGNVNNQDPSGQEREGDSSHFKIPGVKKKQNSSGEDPFAKSGSGPTVTSHFPAKFYGVPSAAPRSPYLTHWAPFLPPAAPPGVSWAQFSQAPTHAIGAPMFPAFGWPSPGLPWYPLRPSMWTDQQPRIPANAGQEEPVDLRTTSGNHAERAAQDSAASQSRREGPARKDTF